MITSPLKASKPKVLSTPRVPHSLQNVFISSSEGEEVNKAPQGSVACKIFPRIRFGGFSRKGSKMICKKPREEVSETFNGSDQFGNDDKSLNEFDFNQDGTHLCKSPTRTSKRRQPSISPQTYLDNMIQPRGYSNKTFNTLQSAYYNQPTELQKSSYGVKMVEIIRKGDSNELRSYLASGLSPNPCNSFGESLVHMVCRLGNAELLRVMLDHGCDLRVADDFGRTPLHDACWAANPSFEVFELILRQDIRMIHMADMRGALPLSYTRKEHWNDWLKFLAAKKEEFWPKLEVGFQQSPPELALKAPNSRTIPDPLNALTPYLAGMLSEGKIEPQEAIFLSPSSAANDAFLDDSYGDDFDETSWGDYSITLLDYDSSCKGGIIHECSSVSTDTNKVKKENYAKDESSVGVTSLSLFDEDIDEVSKNQEMDYVGIQKIDFDIDGTESDSESVSSSYDDDASMDELEKEMAMILKSFSLENKRKPISWSYSKE